MTIVATLIGTAWAGALVWAVVTMIRLEPRMVRVYCAHCSMSITVVVEGLDPCEADLMVAAWSRISAREFLCPDCTAHQRSWEREQEDAREAEIAQNFPSAYHGASR